MERQRRFVCLAEACESIFLDSDSENKPLGDLGELEEDEIDDDGVGDDEVADNKNDSLPVIPDRHEVAHPRNNDDAAESWVLLCYLSELKH